jgi:MFS family permease
MQNTRAPLLNSTLRWFMLGMILANIASNMVFTLLAVYLAELGANAAQIGLVFSAASIVPLALQIFGGWLSDTIGRLRIIAIASVCASFGYLGFVLAPTWQWMMLALALEYISGSVVGPSFSAFIAEQSSQESRARVFSIAQSLYMIVGVVGPPLGGFLAQQYGFKVMLTAAFWLYTCASLLRVWMARASQFNTAGAIGAVTLASLRSNLTTLFGMIAAGGLLTWILITDGVQDIAFRLSSELEPLYLAQVGSLSLEQVGWIKAISSTAIMGAMLLAGWLADRWGERVTIFGGFILEFAGLMLFLQSHNFAEFAISMLIFGAGIGIMHPAYESLVSKVAPEKMRGLVFGLFSTSLGIISFPAPWAGGFLWERISPQSPFAITAGATLIAALLVWYKFKAPGADTAPALEG